MTKFISQAVKKKPFFLRDILLLVSIIITNLAMGCPFKYLFGIACPGCGMTRAAIALLSFDFQAAVHFHPLVFTLPIVAIIYLLRNHIPKKLLMFLIILFFIALLTVYIYRLNTGSDITAFDFHHGAVYRLFENTK